MLIRLGNILTRSIRTPLGNSLMDRLLVGGFVMMLVTNRKTSQKQS